MKLFQDGRRIKESGGGNEFKFLLCKNFCKLHNVFSPRETVKKKMNIEFLNLLKPP
jgi:hypothetical protein